MEMLWWIVGGAGALLLLGIHFIVFYEARKYPVCPKCEDNSQTRRIDKYTAKCQIHGTFKT